jgi:uncharacterized protein YbbK (DUF523 family)
MKEKQISEYLLISACLLGKKCRYDGNDVAREFIIELANQYSVIAVCPEELGGLATPRLPSEICDGVIKNANSDNVTAAYIKGAQIALAETRKHVIKKAYLKSKSPMCGCGQIYDGSFSGQLVKGDGIFTQLLKENYPALDIESVK